MKLTRIYQTLENRGNQLDVESHGPYWCSLCDKDGNLKRGIREPWLGEGYYFWDSIIKDAHWWGKTACSGNYYICQTEYDQHSPDLLDAVGDMETLESLAKAASLLREELQVSSITFPTLLHYLKKMDSFHYHAIRVSPRASRYSQSELPIAYFPSNPGNAPLAIYPNDKVQICFFDKQLLVHPYKIIYPEPLSDDYTI